MLKMLESIATVHTHTHGYNLKDNKISILCFICDASER